MSGRGTERVSPGCTRCSPRSAENAAVELGLTKSSSSNSRCWCRLVCRRAQRHMCASYGECQDPHQCTGQPPCLEPSSSSTATHASDPLLFRSARSCPTHLVDGVELLHRLLDLVDVALAAAWEAQQRGRGDIRSTVVGRGTVNPNLISGGILTSSSFPRSRDRCITPNTQAGSLLLRQLAHGLPVHPPSARPTRADFTLATGAVHTRKRPAMACVSQPCKVVMRLHASAKALHIAGTLPTPLLRPLVASTHPWAASS